MLKPSFIQLNETRFASIASTTVSTVHTPMASMVRLPVLLVRTRRAVRCATCDIHRCLSVGRKQLEPQKLLLAGLICFTNVPVHEESNVERRIIPTTTTTQYMRLKLDHYICGIHITVSKYARTIFCSNNNDIQRYS